MDSMKSLNTSLPSSNHNRPAPPEQLLQAFRTAALSVTNLYKSAVTDQSSARQAGYQDAIDDLLAFLDKENLGLQDGEGWSVRQWATERHERRLSTGHQNDSDDDACEQEKERRSPSPTRSHNSDNAEGLNNPADNTAASATTLAVSTPDITNNEPTAGGTDAVPMYMFIGAPTYAQDATMQIVDDGNPPVEASEHTTHNHTNSTTRLDVVSRAVRTPHRSGGSRHSTRASTRDFTFTTGTKRKLNFPDFFDISNLGNDRDRDRDSSGKSGGKRGRFV